MSALNLRLRRLVRTPYSEQLTLYRAAGTGAPTSVGKIDLHFTSDGVFGTLLVWDEELLAWEDDRLENFLRGLVEDLVEPQGMADVYAVECFAPDLSTYRFLTNSEEGVPEVEEPMTDSVEGEEGGDDEEEVGAEEGEMDSEEDE